ncbi:MAG: transglutaminase [Bacillales bacterium]|jgi:transglutaminase/protease-like cytokinesis protein 3|nr:transglutaminase [Bacillales bacterium]
MKKLITILALICIVFIFYPSNNISKISDQFSIEKIKNQVRQEINRYNAKKANNQYKDLINETEIAKAASSKIVDELPKDAISVSTVTAFQAAVKASYIQMKDEVKINYVGKVWLTEDNTPFKLVEKTVKYDNSSDYKSVYFRYLINEYNVNTISYNDSPKVVVTIKFKYKTTQTQYQQVDMAVTQVLQSIIKPNMSVDDKITEINDFIVRNVSYDTTLQKRSDYDALFGEKSAVCEGYALLVQIMLTKAGIPSHIVTGVAKTPHAWNIVKFSDGWYHLDATWNDPVPDQGNKVSHMYLKRTSDSLRKEGRTWEMNRFGFAK